MNVLVDYDNILPPERSRGLVYLVERIIQAATSLRSATSNRVNLRLYGGWYDGNVPSRRAQALSAEVFRDFPRPVTLPGAAMASFNVNLELAYSLQIDPGRHLWHTYRRYGYVADIACRPPVAAGCVNAACPLTAMQAFISTRTCPEAGCTVTTADIITRPQQKLVDTMLTADAIYLAQNDPRLLCIVSSDDDLWPAIRTAVMLSRPIVHLHTTGHRTPSYYSMGSGMLYLEGDV